MSTLEQTVSPQEDARAGEGLVARVARWTIAHRRMTLIGWVVAMVAILAISSSVGTRTASNFTLPGTESQEAIDLLQSDFPARSGDVDQVVLRAKQGGIDTPARRAEVSKLLAAIAAAPHVESVTSPFSREGAGQISEDGEIAFASVTFDERADELPKDAIEHVVSIAEGARSSQLQVELGGQAIEQVQEPDFGFTTLIGILAAMVVLLISFGSLVAMGLPILTALLGLGTGLGLIAFGSYVVDMPDFATELAVMIGLGVGIDYSLFAVTRFRENYNSGQDVTTAVVGAMNTAGRAIVFAGCTVIIALLGMLALGVSFLSGAAVAAALAVLMTMAAALTALPALLSRFGERIGGSRRRRGDDATARLERRRAVANPTLWERWAQFVQRHPWGAAVAGLALLLALTAPVLGMRLASSDAGNDSTSQTTRRAFDLLAEGFGPGFNGPLQIVAALPSAGDEAALAQVTKAVEADPGIVSVGSPQLSPNGRTALITAYPSSAPQDAATTDLVHQLRDEVLPPVESQSGADLMVAGTTASQVDFNGVLAEKLPLFIAIVVLLSALLLMIVFRSLLIPLQAALMNLLSIGASLGVVVLIFQQGWLGGLLGVEPGPIDAFIPVFVFAIVFGLSMDYEVFLISRVHEEWTHARDPSVAMVRGLGSTGRVITAAATIMVCVFLSFVLLDQRVIKMFGVSLSAAVFLDAFVVRSLLVPATLQLLGRATWMLPAWLERRLPHLSIEPPEEKLEPQEG
ncbi:MAG TPA: MMPL family transporter [Solirubrobacterales bacterium]|jgi:RND superfamily putative drug exporter